jgi:hypothetical protein
MKINIISSVVLFFFSLYVMSSPIVWATYFVYQDYIAETFCVNKQNPDCCGKCFVNEVENEQPKNDLPKIEVRTPELLSFILEKINYNKTANHTLLPVFWFSQGEVSIGFAIEITHPPKQKTPFVTL